MSDSSQGEVWGYLVAQSWRGAFGNDPFTGRAEKRLFPAPVTPSAAARAQWIGASSGLSVAKSASGKLTVRSHSSLSPVPILPAFVGIRDWRNP